MKKGWKDLGEMEELFEKRRQREAKPCIELFLAKISSIVRQLLSGHRLVVYQENGDVVRDAKTISKLLFGQKIKGTFRPRASDSYTLSTIFLAPIAYAGEAMPHLVDILRNSRSRENLHYTTQIVRKKVTRSIHR